MKLFDLIFDKVPVRKTVKISEIKNPQDLYYDNLFTPKNDYPDLNKIAKKLRKEFAKTSAS